MSVGVIDNTIPFQNLGPNAPENVNEDKKSIKERVKEVYDEFVPDQLQEKLSCANKIRAKVWPVIKSFALFFKELIPQLDNILAIFANAAEALKDFFTVIRDVAKVLSEIKFVAIVSVPGAVYDFAMSIYKFVKGLKKKYPAKIMFDRAMGMIDTAIDITKLVAVFVGNVTFGVVAGFLSAVNIIIQGKKLYHSITFHKAHIKTINDDENPLGLDQMSHRDFKNRLDPSDASAVRDKVEDIWTNPNTTAEIKEEVTKAIKRRSIQKIACHTLKIISAAITIIASAILLCCPPLAPVAFGLFGLSALISLAEFITDKVVASHWEKVIDKHFDFLNPEPLQIVSTNSLDASSENLEEILF